MIEDEQERPGWTQKALSQLTAEEISEALTYLSQHSDADDVLARALVRQLTENACPDLVR
ncbi:hypothetical protein [Actinomadura sp. 6N118]|uniref:hypothetical protein n=1 Tax=Actinomadura sp. 6N118 TaxID=3375151 RepID=UPI00379C6DE3